MAIYDSRLSTAKEEVQATKEKLTLAVLLNNKVEETVKRKTHESAVAAHMTAAEVEAYKAWVSLPVSLLQMKNVSPALPPPSRVSVCGD